jgi:hypothetical protein
VTCWALLESVHRRCPSCSRRVGFQSNIDEAVYSSIQMLRPPYIATTNMTYRTMLSSNLNVYKGDRDATMGIPTKSRSCGSRGSSDVPRAPNQTTRTGPAKQADNRDLQTHKPAMQTVRTSLRANQKLLTCGPPHLIDTPVMIRASDIGTQTQHVS